MLATAGAAEKSLNASRLIGPMLGSLLSSSEAADAGKRKKSQFVGTYFRVKHCEK
jgi:hypothetical protein